MYEIVRNRTLQFEVTQMQELISVELEPHQCEEYWAAGLKANAICC